MIGRKKMQAFLNRLSGPEGCDFKERMVAGKKQASWKCKGGTDRSKSEKVLKAMRVSPADRAAIFAVADESGGYCDCEVLFNSTEALLEAAED